MSTVGYAVYTANLTAIAAAVESAIDGTYLSAIRSAHRAPYISADLTTFYSTKHAS